MKEVEIQDKPVEEGANELSFEVEELRDFGKEDSSVEETTQPQTEEVSTPTETKVEEKELDYTPFLDKLSKEIKFMDEEVKIGSLDEIKTLTQKGLNHDRLEQKLKDMENSEEVTYIRYKAKEAGMSPKDYINAVKEFEKKQQEEQDKNQYDELIEKGISEDLAKTIVENNKLAREYQQEKVKKQEQEKASQEKAKKDAEYDKFVKTFPDVDVSKIPSEVLKKSEEVGITTAYTMYQNEQLKKELELSKKNQDNEKKSPIKGTTEHGGVVIDNDPFLKGLGF